MAKEKTMPNLIQIQDRYIDRVLACQTGHWKRVRRGARREACRLLARWGFTEEQQHQIVDDAHDMLVLIQRAKA